jgi:hypothetical protein
MEHRGKPYSIILGIGGKWKWSIEIDGRGKSGTAASRSLAEGRAKEEIDKALAPKKRRLIPPSR